MTAVRYQDEFLESYCHTLDLCSGYWLPPAARSHVERLCRWFLEDECIDTPDSLPD